MSTPLLPCIIIPPTCVTSWYQSLPVRCPPNSSSNGGAYARSDCLCIAGFYGDLSNEDENCTVCEKNALCPTGSIRPLPCPAGFRCESDEAIPIPGFYDGQGHFTMCPAGYFCMNNGVFECEQGTMCPSGSSVPTACPFNLFCPQPNSTEARVCPSGFVCALGNLQPCPTGFLCLQGNMTRCATGMKCENGSSSCDTGFYNQTNQCMPCNDGTVVSSSNGSLQPCPGGFYCVGCNAYPCPNHTYCPLSSFRPIPCPNGSLCLPQSSNAPIQCDTGWAGTPPLCVLCQPPFTSLDNATRCGCQKGMVVQIIGNTTQCATPPALVFATVASLTLAPSTTAINTTTLSYLVDAVAARWCNDSPDCTATVISITDSNGVIRYCTQTGGCPGVVAGRRLLAADAAVDICVSSLQHLPTAPRDTTPMAMVASFVVFSDQQVEASMLVDNLQELRDIVVAKSTSGGNDDSGGGYIVMGILLLVAAVVIVVMVFIFTVLVAGSMHVMMNGSQQHSQSLTDVRIDLAGGGLRKKDA